LLARFLYLEEFLKLKRPKRYVQVTDTSISSLNYSLSVKKAVRDTENEGEVERGPVRRLMGYA